MGHRCRSLGRPDPSEPSCYSVELCGLAQCCFVSTEEGKVTKDNASSSLCVCVCVLWFEVYVHVHWDRRSTLKVVPQGPFALFFETESLYETESSHYWGVHATRPGFLGECWGSNFGFHDWKISIYLPSCLSSSQSWLSQSHHNSGQALTSIPSHPNMNLWFFKPTLILLSVIFFIS